MVYLSDKTSGRDNNLNLIRAVAATAVLVSHAYPIGLGPGTTQPLELLVGHTLGTLSVYAFFCISGFLISMSFVRSSSWLSFMTARVLRLVPGLLLSLVVVAFLMGPIVSTLGVGSYLSDLGVYTFIVKNMSLAFLQFDLPGVFETQPFTDVEGSIWTLFYEVVCYMGVFVLGILGILKKRLWMNVGFALYLIVWFMMEARGLTHTRLVNMHDLALPFIVGMMFYLWQERLPLSFIGVLGLSILAYFLKATVAYDLALVVALSYGVFWLAYIPGGIIRAYNKLGDYSYGIYIYAFPFQGLAVWLMGGGAQAPLLNMAISFPLTLLFSVISWHLVEGPALAAKSAVMARLKPA